jgi:hypothetical protein
MLLFALTINSATRIRLVTTILTIAFFAILGFGQSSVIFRQVSLSFDRVTTLAGLAEGDLTAEGSLTRLTSRNAPVMDSWRRNPIIGWGFSKHSYSDGHVGNQNILQVSGIIGLTIIFLAWITFFTTNFGHRRAMGNRGNVFVSLNLMMVALVIIHSSSTQMFGYDVVFQPFIKIFVVLLVFHLSNLAIQQHKREHHREFLIA